MRALLDKFFPIPDFLRMPAVGLDISDTEIIYVELTSTASGLGVGRYGVQALPENTIVQGVIQDTQKLQEVLAQLQKQLNVNFARVALPESLVYSFVLRIPKVAEHEIRAAIDFQIEEHIPLSKEDIIFDYEVLSQSTHHYRLKVNAIHKQTFETYKAVLEEGSLQLVHLEPQPESIIRAVTVPNDIRDYIMVYQAGDKITVGLIEDDYLVAATVCHADDNLLECIRQHYDYWHTKEVPVVMTTDSQKQVELKEDTSTADKGKVGEKEEKEATKSEDIVEVEKDTARSMYPIVTVGIVKGFDNQEAVSQELDVDVVAATIWNAPQLPVQHKSRIPEQELQKYCSAIGLALSDF